MIPVVSELVELVQVLLYMSDRQERVIQHLNNRMYSEAISSFFLPYKNHKAVIMTQELIDNKNFIHKREIMASTFAIHLIPSDVCLITMIIKIHVGNLICLQKE